MSVNTDPRAIIRLGDLGAGLKQDPATGLIVIDPSTVPDADFTAVYTAGADAFAGKIAFKDTSSGKLISEVDATNLYDATGEYVGTVINFGLPALP